MKNKFLLTLIAVLTSGTVLAGTVKLGWDASTTPDVEYIVYAHTELITETNKTDAIGIMNVGTNLTAELRSLTPGTWYFAATALKAGLESDLSNVISGEIPNAPGAPEFIPLVTITNNGGNVFFLMQ